MITILFKSFGGDTKQYHDLLDFLRHAELHFSWPVLEAFAPVGCKLTATASHWNNKCGAGRVGVGHICPENPNFF